MPIRNYTVPGTEVTIVDYQIAPAPITNPGDIVILLGDLPDQVTISDPLNPGATIDLDIPANTPLIINQDTDLGALSGTEFRNALITLGQNERNLEIVNILPILNSSLPLALCKITKRNGQRPEFGNTKDYFEALENAYENLGNYPAGRIVPMHVAFEDSAVMDQLSNLGVEVYDRVYQGSESNITVPGDYASAIMSNIQATMKPNITDIDVIKTFRYKATPSIMDEVGGSVLEQLYPTIRLDFYLGENETLIDTHYLPLRTSQGGSERECNLLKNSIWEGAHPLIQTCITLQEKLNAAELSGAVAAGAVDVVDNVKDETDTFLAFVRRDDFGTEIKNLDRLLDQTNNYGRHGYIIDPTDFLNDAGDAFNSLPQSLASITITDGTNSICDFEFSFDLTAPDSNFVDISSPNTLEYFHTLLKKSNMMFLEEIPVELDIKNWFAGTDAASFKFNMGANLITEDIDPSPADPSDGNARKLISGLDQATASVIAARTEESSVAYNISYGVATNTQNTYDRSFNSVYRFNTDTYTYNPDFVGITMSKAQAQVTKSTNYNIVEFDRVGETIWVSNNMTTPIEYSAAGIRTTELGNNGVNGYIVDENYDFKINESVSMTFMQGLILPPNLPANTPGAFEYEITIIPQGADFAQRTVEFCEELTSQLNDCTAVMGTRPPVTVSPEDIEAQVNDLSVNLANKNFVGATADNGLYLSVTTGAQKVSNIGGITNFPAARVLSFNANSRTISILGALEFKEGDSIDLEITSRGKIYVEERIVESIANTTSGSEITVTEAFADTYFGNTSINSTRTVSLTNLKDSNGTYLAALYAVESNNYGIDKAPFNYTMPGEGEIFYTRDQLNRLLDVNLTPISRNAFNTSATVIDTPTMAQDSSDFTDQGTVGLIMFFINQLRSIAAPRKGQRFGSGARQIAFQTELEAPFEGQIGETITAYNLTPDWTKLQSEETLDIEFSIREAKKLKVVKITAKLF